MWIGSKRDGTWRLVSLHRIVWELENGPIPSGWQINHSCDNPPCVRPSHLVLGTPASNANDRETRGRGIRPGAQGERNHNAILTEAQVVRFRREWEEGRWATYAEAGRSLGVTYVSARNIVLRRTWRLVA